MRPVKHSAPETIYLLCKSLQKSKLLFCEGHPVNETKPNIFPFQNSFVAIYTFPQELAHNLIFFALNENMTENQNFYISPWYSLCGEAYKPGGTFESGKKKLRIQKYPDTCARG